METFKISCIYLYETTDLLTEFYSLFILEQKLSDHMTGTCNITEPSGHDTSLPVVGEPVVSSSNTTVKTAKTAASETSVKGLLTGAGR